jgi:hypothetical protein
LLSRDRAGLRLSALVIGVAVTLTLFRALVYLLFEQVGFDSDQAIIGLMAKHLSEGRAFPLFLYGQTYMLAVEAWTAAPFFWIGGPTVGALRFSMLAWNIAFGVMLVAGLQRDGGLRGWTALVPALFFLAAPISISGQLFAAQAGTIEPFVYIAVLWFLRRRPLWFGVVLAIGFRNREFTVYALPVLAALDVVRGELTRDRVRSWLLSMVVFFAVWESIEALKPLADYTGPGTRGQLLGGFSGSQVGNLVDRFNYQPAGALVERLTRVGPELLAWFAGAGQVDTNLPIGDRPWLRWVAGLGLVLAAGRLVWLTALRDGVTARHRSLIQSVRDGIARAPFAWYLLGVGATADPVFLAGKPILNGYSRYATLGLLLPVGLTAAVLALDSRPASRRLVAAVVIAWASLTMIDHARVLATVVHQPPSYPAREIADRLVARHVPVASAGYWQAYEVTFLARERVRVASRDFVRIQEYQDLFVERNRDAWVIQENPCPGGERIATWYLCGP